jgi:hypothetical protein
MTRNHLLYRLKKEEMSLLVDGNDSNMESNSIMVPGTGEKKSLETLSLWRMSPGGSSLQGNGSGRALSMVLW